MYHATVASDLSRGLEEATPLYGSLLTARDRLSPKQVAFIEKRLGRSNIPQKPDESKIIILIKDTDECRVSKGQAEYIATSEDLDKIRGEFDQNVVIITDRLREDSPPFAVAEAKKFYRYADEYGARVFPAFLNPKCRGYDGIASQPLCKAEGFLGTEGLRLLLCRFLDHKPGGDFCSPSRSLWAQNIARKKAMIMKLERGEVMTDYEDFVPVSRKKGATGLKDSDIGADFKGCKNKK